MGSPDRPSPSVKRPPESSSVTEPQNITQALAQATVMPSQSSTPLEMSTLDQRQTTMAKPNTSGLSHPPSSIQPTVSTTENLASPSHPDLPSSLASAAIETTQDQPTATSSDPPSDPSKTLLINLLLLNGARHPYKIDEKYMSRRNVSVEDNNPLNMTIYTLKELVWRDWREEWEPRPTSPGMIRLIHAGHMPDDKMRLGGEFYLDFVP